MIYRRPRSISFPQPLIDKVERVARRQHQTVSELVRAAVLKHLVDLEAQELSWKRALAYGKNKAKKSGLRTEEDVYRLIYQLRHGRPQHGAARSR